MTEGSKATKAYWLERVRVLEEELTIAQGPWPMQDVDKPIPDGETVLHTDPEEKGEDLVLEAPISRRSTLSRRRVSPTGTESQGQDAEDQGAHGPPGRFPHPVDLVINVALSITCQMLTFKWKQLVWMLRIRRAVQMEMG